jgi:hypothetical protein
MEPTDTILEESFRADAAGELTLHGVYYDSTTDKERCNTPDMVYRGPQYSSIDDLMKDLL